MKDAENWWKENLGSHLGINELVINLDNGPNSSGKRTQFIKRMTEFSDRYNVKVRLIYYPPYHSKYNPIERCWSRLEEHWNGEILDTVDKAIEWSKTMTWKDYVSESGNSGADRDDFEDAIDFMGWFIFKTQKVNGISKWDAYNQYLNYHEGWGGFKRKSYKKKAWLMKVSRKVDNRARRYSSQLKSCEKELNHGWLWRLFFG